MSYQFGINQLQSTTVPNAKYKTILCRHYQATKQCAIGPKCQFAHGIEEQRQMNDPLPASALSSITSAPQSTTIEQQQKNQSPLFKIPCKYHQLNFCKNGSGCQYVHDSEVQIQPSQQLQPQQQQQQILLLQQQQLQQQQIQSQQMQQQQQQQQSLQSQQSLDPMSVTLTYILMEMQQIFVQEDLQQKIRFATEQARQGNCVQACDQIRTIIHSSDRTVDEIQQYTLLYNQSVAYYKQLLQQ